MNIQEIRAGQIWKRGEFTGKVVACSNDRLSRRILFEDPNGRLFASAVDWDDSDRLGPGWSLVENAVPESVGGMTMRWIAFIARHPIPDADPVIWARFIEFLIGEAKNNGNCTYAGLRDWTLTIPIATYCQLFGAIQGIEPSSRQLWEGTTERRCYTASKDQGFCLVWDEITDLD